MLAAGSLSALALSLGTAASAAAVSPQFGTFSNLTTLAGVDVTFGGTNIPTYPAAITNFFSVGGDTVRVGLIATPRNDSPLLSNDGLGTYTQLTGESDPGLSLWNFSYYAESTGNIADANLKLYYDLDPSVGNDLSTLSSVAISQLDSGFFEAGGTVFQGSQNLGFAFLGSGFDPFAPGEYSFRIGVDNGEFAAINVNVNAVPLPAAGWMLLAGFGGIAAASRRKKAN